MLKTEHAQMVWMELYLAVVKCCEEDHIGSVTRIYNTSGTAVFSAYYDPWGVQTVTTNTIGYRSALCDAFIMEWRKNRSYCGHEMLRSALWLALVIIHLQNTLSHNIFGNIGIIWERGRNLFHTKNLYNHSIIEQEV
ncbi:MAG: hypothetical protein IJJ98_04090 [Prevotella sp.]|nr:hypothetical protein [Prevotella sp.]